MLGRSKQAVSAPGAFSALVITFHYLFRAGDTAVISSILSCTLSPGQLISGRAPAYHVWSTESNPQQPRTKQELGWLILVHS